MQEYLTLRHHRYAAVALLALLALLASMSYLNASPSHASEKMHNFSSVHPLFAPVEKNDATTFACQTRPTNRCYTPQQIRTAYSIQPLLDKGITGKGRSIVILDAFGAPDIESDLKLFDSTFGLNDPALHIIYPDGQTPFDPTNADEVDWSGEISLDVEWSHAVAPDANIELVLAKSDQDTDLISALKYAVDHNLGDVISMSFGENEACQDAATAKAWNKEFLNATLKDITLFASSGDNGAAQVNCDGTSYVQAVSAPAVNPLVTGVGGTQLDADATTGAYKGEVAWNEPDLPAASGGGFSTITHKPFYQYGIKNIPGNYRGVPDVAYNAAVDGGVLTAWSEGSAGPGHFYRFGGTSAGSPQWAGITALADQLGHKRIGFINLAVYVIGRTDFFYSKAFHDITSGNNTITLADANGNPVTIQGYEASKGWDPVTGWGSPRVSTLVPLLVDFTFNYQRESQSQIAQLA